VENREIREESRIEKQGEEGGEQSTKDSLI
jgi:hypothetical protein